MKKLTLYTDGFDVATLSGEINLTSFDARTNDFVIVARLDGLRLEKPTSIQIDVDSKPWEWLNDFPIQEVEFNGQTITPVWKPNQYGQPADLNAFQSIIITDRYLFISVLAKGTTKEVFDRNQPYKIYGEDGLHKLDFDKSYPDTPSDDESVSTSSDRLFD